MLMFWGGKERIPLALKFQVRRQQRRQSSEKSMNVSSPSAKSSASIESTSNSSTGDSSNNSPASLLPSSPMTRRRGNIADPGALLKRRASIAVAAKVSGVRRRSSVAFSEFNANNVAPTEEESIFFNLDVKSGIRGDWCIVRVKGAGPLYRKSLHAGGSSFLSFMFPVWLRLFVSLTADRLSFSDSRTLLTPSFDVSLYDIESVEAVLSSDSKLISQIYPQSGNKSQHTDNHDIVITTKDSDVLLIRYVLMI